MVHSVRKSLSTFALLGLLALPALPATAQEPADEAGAGSPAAAPEAAVTAASDAPGARYLLAHPRDLARFLRLSPAQTTTLLSLTATRTQTVTPLRQARTPLCQQLGTDLGATSPDDAAIGADSLALYQNREQIEVALRTFNTGFSAILGPNQLQAYDTLKKLAYGDDTTYSPVGRCPRQAS
jgi:hypothetical protein